MEPEFRHRKREWNPAALYAEIAIGTPIDSTLSRKQFLQGVQRNIPSSKNAEKPLTLVVKNDEEEPLLPATTQVKNANLYVRIRTETDFYIGVETPLMGKRPGRIHVRVIDTDNGCQILMYRMRPPFHLVLIALIAQNLFVVAYLAFIMIAFGNWFLVGPFAAISTVPAAIIFACGFALFFTKEKLPAHIIEFIEKNARVNEPRGRSLP